MTDEQLEELLGKVAPGEWASGEQFLANEDGEFNGNEWEGPLSGEERAMIDAAWEKHKSALTESPSLARRVIAAEGVIRGLALVEGDWRMDDAFMAKLIAYREASK